MTKEKTPANKKLKKKKPSRLSFRFAKAGDMDTVWKLDRMNLAENWDYFPATSTKLKGADLIRRHYQIIDRWFNPKTHKIVIARQDEKIVGIIWYGIEKDLIFQVELGFLFSIVVDPQFRGQGIGKKLLTEFKRRAKRAGAKYVRLSVLQNNTKAINLYRQEGFIDDTHYMLARLEPTKPEKRKMEAAALKKMKAKNK